MPETPAERARRKFVFGVLEQVSNILGSVAASVLVVGLIAPALAAAAGRGAMASRDLAQIAGLVVAFAVIAALSAAVVRGLARGIDDDEGLMLRRARRDDLLSGG